MDAQTYERFSKRIDRSGACWNWTGAHTTRGYGSMRVKREGQRGRAAWVTVYPHRLSWEHTNGPIPAGMAICHQCDNRSCVRPDHLFLGSIADNQRDMMAKGRSVAKLSPDQVREIRSLHASGIGCTTLAPRFGVTKGTILNVIHRRFYADVHET